jgi:uncharacterized protein YndB with AHSA1/START domain
MATVERSSLIDAPVDKVFTFLDDPTHLPEIWPSMVEVKDVQQLPQGGERYHWSYKMAGMRFEGDSETVEYEPNKHILQKSSGDIPSTFDWTFTPENGSTRFALKVEYEIPQTLLAKLAEPLIVKLNEREADSFVGNLKDRIEA